MPFFLFCPTVLGSQRLQSRYYRQGLVKIADISSADSGHVEGFDVFGVRIQDQCQIDQCIIEAFGNDLLLDRL